MLELKCKVCGKTFEVDDWYAWRGECSPECRDVYDKRVKVQYRRRKNVLNNLPHTEDPKKRAKLYIDLNNGDVARAISNVKESIQNMSERAGERTRRWLEVQAATLAVLKEKLKLKPLRIVGTPNEIIQ